MADDTVDVSNLTAIRGKDWIFNALWAACGEAQVPRYALLRCAFIICGFSLLFCFRCSMNIPITFIFNNGQPFKCLETNTNNGYIVRVSLDESSEPLTSSASFSSSLRGENFRLLFQCRELLGRFSRINEYDTHQPNINDPFICTVSFQDSLRCFS